MMRNIHSENTKPEVQLRKKLYALGFHYRLHIKTLPGSPDIVITKNKVAIFVNGCFWHAHGCKKVPHQKRILNSGRKNSPQTKPGTF